MDVREIVRIKKGIGGMDPPFNLGILLDRERSGKDHVAVLFTTRGNIKVKWKNVKQAGGQIYEGDKKDEVAMNRFLRRFIEYERKGLLLKMDPKEIAEKFSANDLYDGVMKPAGSDRVKGADMDGIPDHCVQEAFTPEEIGNIHFHPARLDPKQISAISSILSDCDDPSRPFFARLDTEKGTLYSPFTGDSLKAIREHISDLEKLRGELIYWEEHIEGDRGRVVKRAAPRYPDPRDADLDDKMIGQLDMICLWSVHFMSTGRWGDTFGLGGTPVTRYGKFDLVGFVWDLAHYMIGSVKRDLPSDLTGMLLRLHRITMREASEMVVDFNLGSGIRTFNRSFPDHVRRSAEEFPEQVKEREKEGRKNLRDLETYTIDPPDAKDFDDAISIEFEGEDTILWVHIADVSHYVREGGLIDGEARYRGTSVYLPTGVLPMLPEQLSENLCSLKEKVDRLAVSTRLVIGRDMEIRDHEHFRSIINVDRNLSYDQAEKWIEERRRPFSDLHELAMNLEQGHERLRLDTPERRLRFSGENDISVQVKRGTKATRMIEQFMVLTNEASARTIRDNHLPVPYRVHPIPDRESIKRFNGIMKGLGIDISLPVVESEEDDEQEAGVSLVETLLAGGKISMGAMANVPEHKEEVEDEVPVKIPMETIKEMIGSYNGVLKKIDRSYGGGIGDLLKILVLRTMPRAFYSTDNIGHFGLSSDCYCHFTSPIRRYPDLLAHRSLTHLIDSEDSTIPPDAEEMEDLLEHVNEMSDQAEEWEREMVDVALSTRIFMDRALRESPHGGIISSLTPSMIYVSLDDGVTEGSIPMRTLSPLRLHLDETESRVCASLEDNSDRDAGDPLMKKLIDNGGRDLDILKLGDRMNFSIHSVSIALGRIGLSICGQIVSSSNS